MKENVKTFAEALDMILDGGRAYSMQHPECFIYVEEMLRNTGEGLGQIKGINLKPTLGGSHQIIFVARSYAYMMKVKDWVVEKEWTIMDGMEIKP